MVKMKNILLYFPIMKNFFWFMVMILISQFIIVF